MTATFRDLGVDAALCDALEAKGITHPFPIQAMTLPMALAGNDLIGQARTGTGKTLAFGLPMLQRIDIAARRTQALIVVPTRELCVQVHDDLAIGAKLGIRSIAVYGGTPYEEQTAALESGVHVVVGTPGRLIDHLNRGTLDLADVRALVLDEADEMLRMGFLEDVDWILEQAPPKESRQTAMFSATMPPMVRRIAQRHLDAPQVAEVTPGDPAIASVDQRYFLVPRKQKLEALCRLLETEPEGAALVFARTRLGCAELAESLAAEGLPAEALHGDMSQAQRDMVLHRLRSGRIRIVIATDVAARGLDVDQITHVVNFDMPEGPDLYVHRIGRTGRAGRTGRSTLFVEPREREKVRAIERFTRRTVREVARPSLAAVAAHRIAEFKATVNEVIEAGEIENYRALIQELAREGELDMTTVAAALARMARTERPLLFDVPAERPVLLSTVDAGPADGRPRSLLLNVGRREGVRPQDIVGLIANEAGMPGRVVGAIEIRERAAMVDVEARLANQIVECLEGTTLCGVRLRTRYASPAELADRSKGPARGPAAPRPHPKYAARQITGAKRGPRAVRK